MEAASITILGGDLRQCYAAEYLQSRGYKVTCCQTPDFPYHSDIVKADYLEHEPWQSDLILAPTPLTRDEINLFQTEGNCPPCPLHDLWDQLKAEHTFAVCNLSKKLQTSLENTGCRILTFGNSPFFQKENARLTAEGLLAEVIRCTPFALSSANILLLGYGCCGSCIAKLFLPLCRNIYVIEQDPLKENAARKDGASPIHKNDFSKVLPQCQILINTVPAPILGVAHLSEMHSSCHIFDIASAPFGFPADTTEKCLLPYYRIPGIPGRFSPVTAGRIIGQTIERMTEHAL